MFANRYFILYIIYFTINVFGKHPRASIKWKTYELGYISGNKRRRRIAKNTEFSKIIL